jgi:Predicted periplasmic lipoprotein
MNRTAGGAAGTRQRPAPKSPVVKRVIVAVAVVVVLVLLALGTKVVNNNSVLAKGDAGFSAQSYGKAEFPKVQKQIEDRAVPAETLAAAIAKDQTAAGTKYGVPGTTGPEMSVSLTGVVSGKAVDGIYPITVAGLPKSLVIRVQTGPAINGTDLRDATGKITFGQFTNQIDYQNAGSALNNQMKKSVLSKIDAANLQGKTVELVGAFTLINPNGWLITPAKLVVK